MPKISIVIPAYNAEHYLEETMQSVLAQSCRDWELVVVDDGSQDKTWEVARAFAERDPRIQALQQPNSGVSAARNLGLNATSLTSEYVIFLDADDVWLPDSLEVLAAIVDCRPDVVGVHGVAQHIDGQGQPCFPGEAERISRSRHAIRGKKVMECGLHEDTDFHMLAYRNCICTPGQALIRRSRLQNVGNFDLNLMGTEDHDLWLRLTLSGNFAFMDQVVINYRRHNKSMSTGQEKMGDADLSVRRKHAKSQRLSAEQKTSILVGLCLLEKDVSRNRLRWAKEALAQKKLIHAIMQTRHAIISYAKYAQLIWI